MDTHTYVIQPSPDVMATEMERRRAWRSRRIILLGLLSKMAPAVPFGGIVVANRETMPIARKPFRGGDFSASGKVGSGKRRRRRNRHRFNDQPAPAER